MEHNSGRTHHLARVVVVAGTFGEKGDISIQYSAAVFNRIAEILSPENEPNLTVCPRGC